MVDIKSRSSHQRGETETEKTSNIRGVQGEDEEEGGGCQISRKTDEEQKLHHLSSVSVPRKFHDTLQTQIQLQRQQLRRLHVLVLFRRHKLQIKIIQ